MMWHSEAGALLCYFIALYLAGRLPKYEHFTMTPRPLNIVVLAAGEGTRMQSQVPKVLHQIAGRSLLGHVLAVADALGAARTVVVVAENTIDQVRVQFGPRYDYVAQAARLGTGHALLQAQPLLHDTTGDLLVLYGDSPLLQIATAERLIAARRDDVTLALLSFQADAPNGYGRVVRDSAGHVRELIEERNATPAQQSIREVNSGFMVFDSPWLWQMLPQVPRNPVKGEYYLTDLVGMAVAAHGPGSAVAIEVVDAREAWGCNDREQLAAAAQVLHERKAVALMQSGITMIDPATTYVDVDVQIGRDTTLLPGTLLSGASAVGERCTIGPYSTIRSSMIGSGAAVRYALVEYATVAAGSVIGPFVHIVGEAEQAHGSE